LERKALRALTFTASAHAPRKRLILSRAGHPVYIGAIGDPIEDVELGKLLRTLYLCDYFGNPVFRTEILDLLNQGEAVHSLQRCVYNGMITTKHGRTMEELGAISGALTLLANIVMAWNTHQLQIAIDRAPADYPDEVLSRIAPIGYKHINLRGILTFDLTRLGPSLLGASPATPKNVPQVDESRVFFVLKELRQFTSCNPLTSRSGAGRWSCCFGWSRWTRRACGTRGSGSAATRRW
jgi:Tn3 transposase DDE domain